MKKAGRAFGALKHDQKIEITKELSGQQPSVSAPDWSRKHDASRTDLSIAGDYQGIATFDIRITAGFGSQSLN